jgi:hypothetical protein
VLESDYLHAHVCMYAEKKMHGHVKCASEEARLTDGWFYLGGLIWKKWKLCLDELGRYVEGRKGGLVCLLSPRSAFHATSLTKIGSR